ncbi:hypothetical protein HK405_010266, partial [Cladochytrium tenue]
MFGPAIAVDLARTESVGSGSGGSTERPRISIDVVGQAPSGAYSLGAHIDRDHGGYRRLSLTPGAAQDGEIDQPVSDASDGFLGAAASTASSDGGHPRRRMQMMSMDPRMLRLEVEATLHRTLEMEYLLTAKELQSFKVQAASAEVEHAAAISAVEEAEAVLRQRRLHLESIARHREEAESLVRFLGTRVSSLSSRLRDGKGRILTLTHDLSRDRGGFDFNSDQSGLSSTFVNAARFLEAFENEIKQGLVSTDPQMAIHGAASTMEP